MEETSMSMRIEIEKEENYIKVFTHRDRMVNEVLLKFSYCGRVCV